MTHPLNLLLLRQTKTSYLGSLGKKYVFVAKIVLCRWGQKIVTVGIKSRPNGDNHQIWLPLVLADVGKKNFGDV